MKLLFPSLILFPLLIACSQKEPKSADKETDPKIKETVVDQADAGSRLYQKHCLACHQSDGRGNPGMYPPIFGNPFLEEDKRELIRLILHGKQGKVEVNGISYNGVMAPFSHLPDEDIAEICNYVYKNFSSSQQTVNAEEVKKVREKTLN